MDDPVEDGSFNLSGFALLDVSNTYQSEDSKQPKKRKSDFSQKENSTSLKGNKDTKEENPDILSKSLFDINVSVTEKVEVKSIGSELADLQAAQIVNAEFSRDDSSFKDDGFPTIGRSQFQPDNIDQSSCVQPDHPKTEEISTEMNPDLSGNNESITMTEEQKENLTTSNFSPLINDFKAKKSLSKTYLGDETSFSLSLSAIECSQYQPDKTDDSAQKCDDSEENDCHEIKQSPSGDIPEIKLELDKSSKDILSKSLFDIDVSITEKTMVKTIDSELDEVIASHSINDLKENISVLHEQSDSESKLELSHNSSSKDILSKSLFDIDVSITEKPVVKTIESELAELMAPHSVNCILEEESAIHEPMDFSFSTSLTEVINGSVLSKDKTNENSEIITKIGSVQMEETTEASLFLEVSTFNDQTRVEETDEATSVPDNVRDVEHVDNIKQDTIQTEREETSEISLFLEVSTINNQTQVEESAENVKAPEVIEGDINEVAMVSPSPKDETAKTSDLLEVPSMNQTPKKTEIAFSFAVEPQSEEQVNDVNSADISETEVHLEEETVEISLNNQTHKETDEMSAIHDKSEVTEMEIEHTDCFKENGVEILAPIVNQEVNLKEEIAEPSLCLEVSAMNDQTQMEESNCASSVAEEVKTSQIEEVAGIIKESSISNFEATNNAMEISSAEECETTEAKHCDTSAMEINFFEDVDSAMEQGQLADKSANHIDTNQKEETTASTTSDQIQLEEGEENSEIGGDETQIERMKSFTEGFPADATSEEQEVVNDNRQPSLDPRVELTCLEETSFRLEVSSINDQTQMEQTSEAVQTQEVEISESGEITSNDSFLPKVNLESSQENCAEISITSIDATEGIDDKNEAVMDSSLPKVNLEPTLANCAEISITSSDAAERIDDKNEAIMDSSLPKVNPEPTQEDCGEISITSNDATERIDDKNETIIDSSLPKVILESTQDNCAEISITSNDATERIEDKNEAIMDSFLPKVNPEPTQADCAEISITSNDATERIDDKNEAIIDSSLPKVHPEPTQDCTEISITSNDATERIDDKNEAIKDSSLPKVNPESTQEYCAEISITSNDATERIDDKNEAIMDSSLPKVNLESTQEYCADISITSNDATERIDDKNEAVMDSSLPKVNPEPTQEDCAEISLVGSASETTEAPKIEVSYEQELDDINNSCVNSNLKKEEISGFSLEVSSFNGQTLTETAIETSLNEIKSPKIKGATELEKNMNESSMRSVDVEEHSLPLKSPPATEVNQEDEDIESDEVAIKVRHKDDAKKRLSFSSVSDIFQEKVANEISSDVAVAEITIKITPLEETMETSSLRSQLPLCTISEENLSEDCENDKDDGKTPPAKLRKKLRMAVGDLDYINKEFKELQEFTKLELQTIKADLMAKSELNEQLTEANKMIENLKISQDEMSHLKEENDTLKTENKKMKKENDLIKSKVVEEEILRERNEARWKKREEELQNSLEESWRSLDETQKRLSDALKVTSEDGSLQKISADENERLKKELDEQFLVMEQLRLSKESSEETSKNKHAENLFLKEQLDEMVTLKAELLSSVKSLEEDILSKNEENLILRNQIEEHIKAKEEVMSYIKTLEESSVDKDEKLKNLNEELIKNIEKKNEEIEILKESEESLLSSVKKLEETLKIKEEEGSKLISSLTAKEKEYEDSLNALNVLIQHQDTELNRLRRQSIKINSDLSQTLIPNQTMNDISLCMSVRESPVKKFLSPRKNLNTTNDLSMTIPENSHSIYLVDKTLQPTDDFDSCDPLNDTDEQFGTPDSSQIGEENFTFEDPNVELNTIKSILNSEDVVNSVQGLIGEVIALKENLEESQREMVSFQSLIYSFNRFFNHENLDQKALMEINLNKMAEIKFDELSFLEGIQLYKTDNEKLKNLVENLQKEKNNQETELNRLLAFIEMINQTFSFDSEDTSANFTRIAQLKDVFPQQNLIDAIIECKNENEKLQSLVENVKIDSKNNENEFKKSLDLIESINKVFDFDGPDALSVLELNISKIAKLKEAFPESKLIDAIAECKNDHENLQNLVENLRKELDVKENELRRSLNSIDLANEILNSDGQDSDFESNLNQIKKLKQLFPHSNFVKAIFDCKSSNEKLQAKLSKMEDIASGLKDVQNYQEKLKDIVLNFKSSIDSNLKEAIDLTSLTQSSENLEISDIQNFNLLVREISRICDFDDSDILTSLKMIRSYVNKNKQGVEMVLNLLNHSTDDFWNFIFEKIRSLQEELLDKYSTDEKIRKLKNELSDADDFKQKFANELAALQPENNVRDLMKLPLIELHAKMLSTIMEKEQILLDDMRKEYEEKLQVASDQNKQIEEELKRCKLWISELESENEKINKECREIKVGSESLQETLNQRTSMLDKIKEELREASEKLNDRSSQVCYCNKSDLLSERFEDLSLLLKQKTETCESFEKKFNECSVKVLALEKLITDKEIEIKNLKNKLEAKADEEAIKEKELKNTINTLNGDLKRLQNELNEAKKSKGDKKLEQEIVDLTEKMKSDEKSFSTLRKNLLDDLKVKALRIKELESKVKSTANEYKSILNLKNEECEKLENRIKEFNDFVNKLEKKHISSKENYLKDKKKYESQITTMSDQLKELSDKLTQVDTRMKILDEIEQVLNTSDSDVVRILKEKLSEIKKIAESLEEEKEKCTQLDQENDDMCATLKFYEKENCEYINKVCEYEKIVEKYTSDLKEMADQKSNLLKKLDERNDVEEKLKNDLKHQETVSNELEQKLKQSQGEWEKKIINYEKTVEKLESDMKKLTQTNEELQKRLDSRSDRQEEFERELKMKDNAVRRSEEKLKAYRTDYQNILDENQNLQAQIEVVNAKLAKALIDLTSAQLNPNSPNDNSLQKENVQLSCNLISLNEKNGKLEYEVESLKQALKEKNESISRYRSELENVKKQQGYRNFSLGLSRINNSGSEFENKLKECESKIMTFEKENLILKKLAQKRLSKINLYEERLKNLGCFSETDVPSRDASASVKPNMKPSH